MFSFLVYYFWCSLSGIAFASGQAPGLQALVAFQANHLFTPSDQTQILENLAQTLRSQPEIRLQIPDHQSPPWTSPNPYLHLGGLNRGTGRMEDITHRLKTHSLPLVAMNPEYIRQRLMREPHLMSRLSLAERYDVARGDYSLVFSNWEWFNRGPGQDTPPMSYEGFCNGLCAAGWAFRESEPRFPVNFINSDGLVVPFTPDEVKSLLAASMNFLDEESYGQIGLPKKPASPLRFIAALLGLHQQNRPISIAFTDEENELFNEIVLRAEIKVLGTHTSSNSLGRGHGAVRVKVILHTLPDPAFQDRLAYQGEDFGERIYIATLPIAITPGPPGRSGFRQESTWQFTGEGNWAPAAKPYHVPMFLWTFDPQTSGYGFDYYFVGGNPYWDHELLANLHRQSAGLNERTHFPKTCSKVL